MFENGNVNNIYAQTKIAICYFGVGMFEMINSRLVCGVFSLDKEQAKNIASLAKKGIIHDLGSADDKDLENRIISFIEDKNLHKLILKKIKNLRYSNGDLEVAKIMQKDMLIRNKANK